MIDLNCPYCNAGLEICHDDGFGYEEDVLHQMECRECEKNFVFQTFISIRYKPKKADCLNGGAHNWQPTHTYPIESTCMHCSTCDEIRTPTDNRNHKKGV